MSKRLWVGATLGLVAILAAGGLFASNMGFKLNYPLDATGTNGSASGTSTIALPYNQQTNLIDAKNLIDDINATVPGSVVAVSRFLKSANSFESYSGAGTATAFPLVPGQAYLVQVSANVNYIIVGSENPGLVINLDAAGTNGSASGNNFYAYPYHSVSNDAKELIDEINAAAGSTAVVAVSRFLKNANSFESYSGTGTATAFPLVPGQGYIVQVNQNVAWVPAHF